MEAIELLQYVPWIAFGGLLLGGAGILASVHNTRLKIKHGYPLEGMWGQSLKPAVTTEAMERVKLVTQENAQLRAEVSAMQERLAVVERIVTDDGYRLSTEIERLREEPVRVEVKPANPAN